MTKGQRLALGIATIPPLIYFPFFFLSPVKEIFSLDITSPEVPDWILIFAAVHFLMFLYTGLLFAFIFIHLFGNRNLSRDRKILWALFLIGGNIVAAPLYWYFHVWKGE